MNTRAVAWLLAAGVVLVGVAIWLASQRHLERAALAGDLVLPGLEHKLNQVSAIKLRKGDGTHATLNIDKASWQVAERGWPADFSKVRKLLLDMAALNIVEEKTRDSANYPLLGVEDVTSPKATGTAVDLTASGGSWALIVGKPSSGGKSGYVRVAGAAQSLLAAPLLSVDAEPKSWLDHTLIDISAQQVRQVEEHPANGAAFSATRAKKEDTDFVVTPLPKGREVSGPGAAAPLASALSALSLDDVQKVPTPPAAPAGHAVYRTFDGLEIEVLGRKDGTRDLITIGARSTDPQSAVRAQQLASRLSGWEFEIPEYKYTVLFSPLDDLLKKLPEPVKAPAKPSGKPAPSPAPKG